MKSAVWLFLSVIGMALVNVPGSAFAASPLCVLSTALASSANDSNATETYAGLIRLLAEHHLSSESLLQIKAEPLTNPLDLAEDLSTIDRIALESVTGALLADETTRDRIDKRRIAEIIDDLIGRNQKAAADRSVAHEETSRLWLIREVEKTTPPVADNEVIRDLFQLENGDVFLIAESGPTNYRVPRFENLRTHEKFEITDAVKSEIKFELFKTTHGKTYFSYVNDDGVAKVLQPIANRPLNVVFSRDIKDDPTFAGNFRHGVNVTMFEPVPGEIKALFWYPYKGTLVDIKTGNATTEDFQHLRTGGSYFASHLNGRLDVLSTSEDASTRYTLHDSFSKQVVMNVLDTTGHYMNRKYFETSTGRRILYGWGWHKFRYIEPGETEFHIYPYEPLGSSGVIETDEGNAYFIGFVNPPTKEPDRAKIMVIDFQTGQMHLFPGFIGETERHLSVSESIAVKADGKNFAVFAADQDQSANNPLIHSLAVLNLETFELNRMDVTKFGATKLVKTWNENGNVYALLARDSGKLIKIQVFGKVK